MNWLVVLSLTLAYYAVSAEHSPEEGNFFEGDMVLTRDQKKAIQAIEESKKDQSIRAAISPENDLQRGIWLNNGRAEIIRYYIGPELYGSSRARRAILEAISGYLTNTCIRFQRVYRIPDGPHIRFMNGNRCSSPVGKLTRRNIIRLGSSCWQKGIVQHEIAHSLGFYHEQSRPDRDEFVEIVSDNIVADKQNNFLKYGYDRIDSRGFAYDIDSVMHYGGKFFSKDRNSLTIRTIDRKLQWRIGQRDGLSPGDISQLRALYQCN